MDTARGRSRHIFVAIGSICLALGVLGIVLPLLPTTPLLLLAAACYARGSERFYLWLLNHRLFGRYIKSYRSGAGIPLRAKLTGIIFVWVTILASSVFAVSQLWSRALLIAMAAGISFYLLRLPTCSNKNVAPVQERR